MQRGNKYSVYLTFIDYHDTEIIKVALTGLKSDEELSNEVTLGLMEDEKEKKLTFDVIRLLSMKYLHGNKII